MTAVIETSELHFSYPDGGFGLSLPRWSVSSGRRVAVMGPSGCGKSTLLNLIAGALPVSRGTLKVCGVDLVGLGDAERRRHRIQQIGFVFQDFPLVDYLTVSENVLLPYRVNPILKLDSVVKSRRDHLLRSLEIHGLAQRFPNQLSQGERQRVAIARALVTEPPLLLADEPTAGLDERRSKLLLELFSDLVQRLGITMVMVTHDRRLCEELDEVLFLGQEPE